MTIAEKIGKNIKDARKFKGLTQREIAEMLFMTQQQYSRFENGIFELNYDQILKICEILEITPNEFFYKNNKNNNRLGRVGAFLRPPAVLFRTIFKKLSAQPAAVHRERKAVDVVGSFRGKKDRRAFQIGGRAPSACWDTRQNIRTALLVLS